MLGDLRRMRRLYRVDAAARWSSRTCRTSTCRSGVSSTLTSLSGREGEIVKLLMEGETNQGICNKLYIAAGTVKAHNHSIYKKLGIENRSQVLLKYTDYLERSAQEARLFC
ncbi:MAG: response regulator transcription factor [Eggerthellaceae bacterium]